MRLDMKGLLRLTSTGILDFLRVSPRMFAIPSLVIYPTSACNYDCFMCVSRRSNKTRREMMDVNMLEDIIEQSARMLVKPRLHFSGMGEPLIYPQISRVMALCKARGMTWSVTTNGLTLKKHAAELVANHCHNINLSIHGTPDQHVIVTNTPGSWEVVREGLEILTEEKRKQRRKRPLVALNCVVNNENVSYLPEILEAYAALPVNSVTFQHLIFSVEELEMGAGHLITDPGKLEGLAEFVEYVDSGKTPIKARFYPRIKPADIKGYYTDRHHPFNDTCVMPWMTARVNPDGQMQMCGQFFGSVTAVPVAALVNSSEATHYRQRVRTGNFRESVCFRCCHRQYYSSPLDY